MKKEGFPRRIRIKKESEFWAIIKKAPKSYGPNLTLFRMRGEDKQGQRFGIKIAGGFKGAAIRNRVKRSIREVLRKNKHEFLEDESVVVLCKVSAGTVESGQLREELENLIRQEKANR
jgi:ribonuclease P protein component